MVIVMRKKIYEILESFAENLLHLLLTSEPISKRFSWVKVEEGENFTHRNILNISRI
jgi:hypothetical protein